MWSFPSDSTSTLVHISKCGNGDVCCKMFFPLHCCFLDVCVRSFDDSYTPYYLKASRIIRVMLAEGSSYTLFFLPICT